MVCALNPKLSLPAAGMPSSSAIGSFRSPALSILLVAAVQSAYVTPKLNAGALKQARHIQLTNHGLGVDLKRIARAALAASKRGFSLKVTTTRDGWHYSRGVCPAQDMSCYFKAPQLNVPLKDENEAMNAITVPTDEIQREIELRAEVPSQPCGVIHVRHSDTLLNFGWGQSSKTPLYTYLNLSAYVAAMRAAAPHMYNLVLLTDDQNVVDDVQDYDKDFDWYYLKRSDGAGPRAGGKITFRQGPPGRNH